MAQIVPARHNWYFGNSLDFKQTKDDILTGNVEKLINILLELFTYEGLPESIPAYELEKLLLLTGSASLIKVNGIWYANRSGLGGELNAYYHPKKDILVNPWINGGFSETRDVDSNNCVLIWNNRLRTSVMNIILKYAHLLTEVEITLRQTSKIARISTLIVASDDLSKASAEKVLEDIEEGDKLSVIGGSAYAENIKSLPYEIEYDYESITRVRQYAEKSFLKEFGISTNNESKSQYVSDENLSWEFEPSRALITSMYKQRQDDIEKFNAISGLNVSVDYGEILKETQKHYEEVMSQYTQDETSEESPEEAKDGGSEDENNAQSE